MQFQNAAIAVLAGLIFVLAFAVGWLYWQQARIHQSLNTLAMVLAEMSAEPAPIPQEIAPPQEEDDGDSAASEEEDDRLSVEELPAPKTETVSGPPPTDTDDLEGKTRKELQEILTKKGIPFGKNDSKNVLIQFLKATA